jgi:hypothetical protein
MSSRRIDHPAPRRRRARLALLVLAAVSITLGFLGAVPAEAAEPISSANARFVAASYQELLGRPVDDAALDYQLGRIASGGDQSRLALTLSLLFSREGAGREVGRAYQSLLLRSAEPAGAEYWTNHLTGRGLLELRVLLLASDEFFQRAGGTNQAWLGAFYNEVLERPIDAAGQSYWLGVLDSGVPRASVAGAIHQSNEALGHRVEHYFNEILSRQPSEVERQAGVTILLSRGERYLRAHLWASDEAFESYLQEAWS